MTETDIQQEDEALRLTRKLSGDFIRHAGWLNSTIEKQVIPYHHINKTPKYMELEDLYNSLSLLLDGEADMRGHEVLPTDPKKAVQYCRYLSKRLKELWIYRVGHKKRELLPIEKKGGIGSPHLL